MSAYTTTAPTKFWTTARIVGAITGFCVLGIPFLASDKIPLFPAVLLAAVVTGAGAWIAPNLFKTRPPADFIADFRSAQIALDVKSNQLWVDPDKGKPFLIGGGALRTWRHEWISDRNAFGKEFRTHNRIQFSTVDMKQPTFEVSFRSYEEASNWHARLENWLNAS